MNQQDIRFRSRTTTFAVGRSFGKISAAALGLTAFLAGGLLAASPIDARELVIGMGKGETKIHKISSIANRCSKATKWQIKLKNLKLASAPKKVKVPPQSKIPIEITLDSSRSKKRAFNGTIELKCVDCGRKCPGGEIVKIPVRVTILDFEKIRENANEFLVRAESPVRLAHLTVQSSVTLKDLRGSARQLLHSTVFLDDKGEPVGLPRGDGSNLDLGSLEDQMISENLVEVGHFLVRTNWQQENGERFSTLASIDVDGIVYEPMLFFTSISDLRAPEPRKGSWVWGPWELKLTNGLGRTCLEVQWTVRMEHDGCAINEPGSHVSTEYQKTNCWSWSQKTLFGESSWCRGNLGCSQGCSAGGGKTGESCIKWGVVTYVAQGFSGLTVDTKSPRSHGGIPLPETVSFQASPFGNEAIYSTTCNLCALSGGLPCSSDL